MSSSRGLAIALLAMCAGMPPAPAKTLQFSGYVWEVRPDEVGGPGPNHWSEKNAWVDPAGHLHLLLAPRDGVWFCPEVFTREKFGFGRYRFVVEGPIDRLDPAIVLGLFDYPESGPGPDGTHEIDIEFARWGRASHPNGNYTIFPAVAGAKSVTRGFEFRLPRRPVSAHTFTRRPDSISFASRAGRRSQRWDFTPADPAAAVTRLALPVHLNLWLFEAPAPADGQPVEIVIRAFKFTASGP